MRPPLKLFVLKSFVRKAERRSKITALSTPDYMEKHSLPILRLKSEVIACWDNVCVCFWWQLRGMTKYYLCIVSLATWSGAAWGEIGDYQFPCITKTNNISFPIHLLSSSLNLQPKTICLHSFLFRFVRTKCEYHSNEMFLNCYISLVSYVESTNLKTTECTHSDNFWQSLFPL